MGHRRQGRWVSIWPASFTLPAISGETVTPRLALMEPAVMMIFRFMLLFSFEFTPAASFWHPRPPGTNPQCVPPPGGSGENPASPDAP